MKALWIRPATALERDLAGTPDDGIPAMFALHTVDADVRCGSCLGSIDEDGWLHHYRCTRPPPTRP